MYIYPNDHHIANTHPILHTMCMHIPVLFSYLTIQAHRYKQVKLTGPAYVWILPSFYDPRWWELSEDEIDRLHPSQQCSNYEMEEILNTTHVFSIGVYNYQYESLDSGWPQSVNIVRHNNIYSPWITPCSKICREMLHGKII